MTQSFIDMMYYFSCSAHGIEPEYREIEIDRIYSLSVSQGIWYMVYDSLRKISNNERLQELGNGIKTRVIKNIKRKYFIHSVLKKLDEKKIPYCMLKGETLSYLYKCTELRISGDTDVYVGRENEKRVLKIFKESGFEIRHTPKTHHHSHCYHNLGGLVEIHHDFYDELFEDTWFDNKIDPVEEYIKIKADDGYNIQILNITDGAIFVCFHMIKHFLLRGIGIRQIMDTLLYFKHYKNEIDWNRVNEILRYLKYDIFVEYIKGIGCTYLGFKQDDFLSFKYDETISNDILNDCENGGVFGFNDENRRNFYQLYTSRRFERFNNSISYEKYMTNWQKQNIMDIIFGTKEGLQIKFPYCKKIKLLLPVACIHRWFRYGLKIICKKDSIGKHLNYQEGYVQSDEINKRMELIEKLDMV